jgi:hypothetical protein
MYEMLAAIRYTSIRQCLNDLEPRYLNLLSLSLYLIPLSNILLGLGLLHNYGEYGVAYNDYSLNSSQNGMILDVDGRIRQISNERRGDRQKKDICLHGDEITVPSRRRNLMDDRISRKRS